MSVVPRLGRAARVRSAARVSESRRRRRRRSAASATTPSVDLDARSRRRPRRYPGRSAWRSCRSASRCPASAAECGCARRTRPARAQSSDRRDRTPSSGSSRVRPSPQHERRRPSAISAGIESPIGEPLAMLPPSVPALRIGGEAKRRAQLVELRIVTDERGEGVGQRDGARRSRCDASVTSICASARRRCRRRSRVPSSRCCLVTHKPDVGAAGENARVGMRARAAPRARRSVRRREISLRARASARSVSRRWIDVQPLDHPRSLVDAVARRSATNEQLIQCSCGCRGVAVFVHPTRGVDDRPVAGAAAQVARQARR